MKKMLGRILSLALCILMIATSIGVYTAGVFAAGNTIYVSSGGNDANAGTSIDTAVKTLSAAAKLAGADGTVIVTDTVDVAAAETIGSCKITGLNSNAVINVKDWAMRLSGAVTFENVTLNAKAAWSYILANGHKLVIGDGVTVTADAGITTALSIRGGGDGNAIAGSCEVVIKSGAWKNVVGGTRNKDVEGNTHITIYDSAVVSVVNMGNENAKDVVSTVKGSATLKIVGAANPVPGGISGLCEANKYIDITEFTGTVPAAWSNTGAVILRDAEKIPDDAKPVSAGGVVGIPGKVFDTGAAEEKLSDVRIYLSDNGSDNGDGTSIATAVKTLAKANSLVGAGGTIVIADVYTHKTGDKILASRLEGFTQDCVFDIANWRCDLGTNCTIDNITLNASYNWAFILCQGYALTVGENVKTTKSGAATVPLSIRGGGENSSVSGNTNITLKSGDWGSVMGGTKKGGVSGNTNVTVYSGTSVKTLAPGNDGSYDVDVIGGVGTLKLVGSKNCEISAIKGTSIAKSGTVLDVTEYTAPNKTTLQNMAAEEGFAIYSDKNSKPVIVVPEKPKPTVPKTGTPYEIGADETVVYISDLGLDTNDGKTTDTPVKTIKKALEVGGTGCTVMVVDSYTSKDAKAVGACKIVGCTSNSKFSLGAWAFLLGGDITFENITMVSATKYAYLLAQGNTLTIGEGVTCIKADGVTTLLGIRGGGEGAAVNKTTNVIIKSGSWGDVHGGTRNASINADTYVTLYEGADVVSLNIGNNGVKEGNTYKANGTIKLVGNPKFGSIVTKPDICEGEMVIDLTEYTGTVNEKWSEFATVVTDKEKLPEFVKEFYAASREEYDLSELTNFRFVSDSGDDANDGLTKEKPMKTIKAAATAMGEGGTVVITGTYTLKDYTANLPSFNITSASKKDRFVMELWALHTNNTKIYNLNFVIPKNHNFILHCGKPLYIGKNVNCLLENGATYYVGIRGNESGDVAATDITIESGSWENVFAGTKNANLLGNAKITVSGGTVGTISVGNDSTTGRILGSATITLKGKPAVNSISGKSQIDGYTVVDISEFDGVSPVKDTTFTVITEKGQNIIPVNKAAIFINGYPDGTFLPEKVMTRAEAITVASKISGFTSIYKPATATAFTDLKAEDWYYNNVLYLEGFNALGFFGNVLDANKGITRGEFVKLISGMIPEKSGDAPKFTDVPESHAYYKEIILAAKAGLVNGYPDGTFLPDNTLKRSEIVTILNRLADRTVISVNTAKITKFSDIAGHWAAPQIIAASCPATTDDIIIWHIGKAMSTNSPVDKSTLDLSTTKAALEGVDVNDGAAAYNAIEAYAVKRRAEIANTATSVNVTGTKYYVSSVSGNDANDGKTPETAWQTLDKVSSAALSEGDGVFFKRGEIFRGQLKTQKGVTYSAYGEGAKPAIYGSLKNYANIGFWEKTNKENVYVSKDTFDKDVGLIVFDNGKAWSDKEMLGIKGFVGALTADLKMYHDKNDNKVYLYSTSDPNTRWESIEIAQGRNGITGVGHNVTLDNLCVKYAGAHGIGYGDGTKGLTVQNCEIGWIGGMIQPGRDAEQVRFGNGVEIYVSCFDYTIKNCHIYQCYDAGITHQYFQTQSERVDMKNIKYIDNVIEYCVYNIEYVNAQPQELGVMENVEISGNLLLHGGEGFGIQRRDHGEAVIKGWSNVNHAVNFVYYDNIIATMEPICKLIWMGVETFADMPEMYGNVFAAKEGSPFGIYGLKTNNKVYTYDSTLTNLTIGLDDNTFIFVK